MANMTLTEEMRALVRLPRPTTLAEASLRLGELETALRESEDRAKATFEQAAVGIAHQTLEEEWLWVNKRFCEIVGYSREKLLGLTLGEITHPEDRAAGIDFSRRVRAGAMPEYTIEKRFVREDGRTVWAQLTVSMIHPPSGAPSYLVGFLEDITTRRRTEQRLAAQYAVARLLGERPVTESSADALRDILEAICSNLEWDVGVMWTAGERATALHRRACWQRGGTRADALARFVDDGVARVLTPGEPLAGRVWRSGEPAWIYELGADAYHPQAAAAREAGLQGAFAFPVKSGGIVHGVIECFSSDVVATDEELLRAVTVIGSELGQSLERSRKEEAIRESEERFRRLTDVTLEGVVIHDGGMVLDANPSFARMFGYELFELLGRDVLEFLPAPESRHLLRRNVRIGSEQPFEAVGLRKDGSRVALEIMGRATSYRGRNVSVTSVRDVTERKRAEEQALQLVREQAARVEAEAAGQRAAFLAEAGRLLGASFDYQTTLATLARLAVPVLADYCVVDVREGERYVRLGLAHPDPAKTDMLRRLWSVSFNTASAEHPSRRAVTEAQPILVPEITPELIDVSVLTEEHRRYVAEMRPCSMMAVPLKSSGHVIGVITLVAAESGRRYGADDLALAEELARRAALAVENARLFHEAQQATRARDDMLGIVAHDLRNPLGTILMATQLLLEVLRKDEHPREHKQVGMMRRAADRMNRLIQDLLDVKRIESGGLIIETRPEHAATIVGEAVEMLRPLATDAGLTLESLVPEELPLIQADPARIQQVLSNLVGNAIKFTPSAGRITIRAERGPDSCVRLCVRDTGTGIPPDQIPHIFGRFWQGRRSDSRGVGLGLAIVKGIVEGHGGRIWVESRPGVGSEFIFTVPIAMHAEAAAHRRTANEDRVRI